MANGNADMKLEVVVIPVSDVDRSKAFYGGLGWRLDADFGFPNGFRIVQFTPPGSACSVQFGNGLTPAAPGSARGNYLVVANVQTARVELAARGVDVSGVFHATAPGAQFQPDGASGRVAGIASDHGSYTSFATFSDPDGNGWLVQEVTTRLPGRVDSTVLTFAAVAVSRVPCVALPRLTANTKSKPGRPIPAGPTGTPRICLRSLGPRPRLFRAGLSVPRRRFLRTSETVG